ncbi:MAG: CRISPR system precrRNA processing endoribonuclease RAMP protein Cas6 [Desulfobacterales bacterium]|nr:CRISPR system precrRNA processing endoribonuclease RAMP protein Cas6 [Desulfobacterales bacterium]
MLFGKYQFFCRFENEAFLPYYKGSTFRGVFGHALKRVVCALRNQECEKCLLKERCVYALVFETRIAVKPPRDLTMSNSPPPPFVIEPPLTTETIFSKNSAFDFNLLLFGKINSNFPYFIYAFEQMGKIGVGRRTKGERGLFRLNTVKVGEDIIYSDTDQLLNDIEAFDSVGLNDPANWPEDNFRLRLVFDTPLRFKIENRLSSDLPFDFLVRAMMRRVSFLLSCYGDGNPSLDYTGLIERATQVRIVESSLKWFDWRRYSQRQERGMNMGGLIGSVTYEGKIGEFMPFVDFCSKVHIGKQTTFGLGKINAEII